MYMVALCLLFVHIIAYISALEAVESPFSLNISACAIRSFLNEKTPEKRRFFASFLWFSIRNELRYALDDVRSALAFDRIDRHIFVVAKDFAVFAINREYSARLCACDLIRIEGIRKIQRQNLKHDLRTGFGCGICGVRAYCAYVFAVFNVHEVRARRAVLIDVVTVLVF